MKPSVVVLDYGSGNLRSAVRAVERAGAEVELTGDLDADLADGDAAAGIVAPRDVTATRATASDSGVELSAVSVRAGVVRLDTGIGLSAELSMDEAIDLGDGGLPRAGQRYVLTPQRMRIVGG